MAGSSSMGALRAAELWPYGMRGVGEVFRLHRDLVVTSDDEVAVIHCSAEEGYRPLSEPLVNIRIALGEAHAAGAIGDSEEARLLALARAMPFRSRSFRLLSQVAAGELGRDLADRFDSWRRAHGRDAKADDARLLLRMAAAGDPELCPAGPGDTPIPNVRTHHTEAWALKFQGTEADGEDWVSDADVTVAIMLLHPGFPARHRLDVLASLGGTSWDDPRAVDLALAAARQRGLDERSSAVPDGWLTPRERCALPPAGQLATILGRAFGTVSSYRISPQTGGSLLADGAVRDWGRRVASAASRGNRLLPAGAHRRLRYRDEVVDRLFAREWQCAPGDFEGAVWDRGISGIQEFRRLAEPFASYLKAGIRLAPPQSSVTKSSMTSLAGA